MPISIEAVTITNWSLTAVCILLVAGRYIIRFRIRKRLYLDDLFQGIALVTLLGFSGTMQAATYPAHRIFAAQEAGRTPSVADTIQYRKLQNAVSNCFFISIWAVKLTFLFFYRLLFDVSPAFMKAWWITLVFLVVTFWIPVAGNLTLCGPADKQYDVVACDNSLKYQRQYYIYICATQVFTDLVVMVLPLAMLRNLQMRLFQKIGLGIVFCVAFVTIAMDILRTDKSYGGGGFADSALYSILELDLAVIVACIPTYRAFFGIKRKIPLDGRYLDLGVAPTTQRDDGTLHSTSRGRGAAYSLEDLPSSSETDTNAGYVGVNEFTIGNDTEILNQDSSLDSSPRIMHSPKPAHLA